MKKILSIMLAVFIMAGVMGEFPSVKANSINIGDYVLMGRYYDEPILWRCVDIDENGPLMLSYKILTIKPFDAQGQHPNDSSYGDRASSGSNLWETSNMRSWLNSTATAGNVEWLCGNPPTADKLYYGYGYNAYADEKGFLADGNFTQSERNALKQVTQKSILNFVDKEMATSGSERHVWRTDIDNIVQNYDDAYAHNVTDKMFLLDVKQINKVYQNSAALGDDYYIGQPTQKCVDNSDYTASGLAVGEKWDTLLRSPNADGYYPENVRHIGLGGDVTHHEACNGGVGVRPAFYINLSSVIFKSGTGSAVSPYVIDGDRSDNGGGENIGIGSNGTSSGAPSVSSFTATHNGTTYNALTIT